MSDCVSEWQNCLLIRLYVRYDIHSFYISIELPGLQRISAINSSTFDLKKTSKSMLEISREFFLHFIKVFNGVSSHCCSLWNLGMQWMHQITSNSINLFLPPKRKISVAVHCCKYHLKLMLVFVLCNTWLWSTWKPIIGCKA